MDQARLVTRLLSEVGAARAAILASYSRLWRTEAEPPSEPADAPPSHELRSAEGRGATGRE